MKLLYNTQTQLLQPYPRDDDATVEGLDPVYQVFDVLQNAPPESVPAGYTFRPTQVIDTEAKTVTRGYEMVAITPLPAPVAAAYQVREYLIHAGISLSDIPALIASATPEGAEREVALMRWEYVTNVPKEHPLVAAVASALNLDLDQVWDSILAIE